MHSIKTLKDKLLEIENRIGINFKCQDLLIPAFVHPSFINENRSHKLESYERLEFLGDTVLNLLVSGFLYSFFDKAQEGELSWMRASLIDAKSCAYYLKRLELEAFVLMSKGEANNEGKGRDTILSDVFEAILGAIYIDSGMAQAALFFKQKIEPIIAEKLDNLSKNPKMVLQSHLQKLDQSIPTYEVIREEGLDHQKRFVVTVSHGGKILGEGVGSSKKEAQYEAALQAIEKLGL